MTHLLPDFRDPSLTAAQVRSALELQPHPEGCYYRELWRDAPLSGGRGAASSILFVLAAGERSHWHRVDAAEIWVWLAGAPLLLETHVKDGNRISIRLGPAAGNGETFQASFQRMPGKRHRVWAAWTLVSCIVAPAFQFEGFELAPPGWSP